MATDRIPFTAKEEVSAETGAPSFILWDSYRPKLDSLTKDWEPVKKKAKLNRNIRKIDVDVDSLRAASKLKADETLITVRVVDENIRKEKPDFVNYLTQSERLAIFYNSQQPEIPVRNLEIAYTKGMNYPGMQKQLFKWVDGAQLHGWDFVEVTYDPSKPLHCGIEHIGHENLLFSKEARDIQADEFILRRFKVTSSQLKRWVTKHGFDEQQVKLLTERDTGENVPDPIEIYKCWIKYEGIVYVGWASLEGARCTNWLKQPMPLNLGRKEQKTRTEMQPMEIVVNGQSAMIPTPVQVPYWEDLQETMFPVFQYTYMESEEQCITEQIGRAFMDRPWQDAQIAIRSLLANGGVRASNVYGAPEAPSDTGAKFAKLDLTLEHGCFYNTPFKFWSPPYPDVGIMRLADGLDVRKQAETGQMAAAVVNRDDSRKTAEELQTAKQEQDRLKVTSLMLFSLALREVLNFSWYIIQNQAIQGNVIVLPYVSEMTGGMTVNHPLVTQFRYDLFPAGDTDVLRRAERIQRRIGMIEILAPTPVWPEFLKDLIRDVLPENAEKYISILDQAEANKDQMLMAMAEMLKSVVMNPDGTIKPEFAAMAPQLQQMFATVANSQQQMMQQQSQQQKALPQNEPTAVNR